MPPTYPLTVPTVPAPKRSFMRLLRAVGQGKTPFTFQQQVERHQGAQWQIELQYPSMSRAQAAEWRAFVLSMNGRFGTCLLGDYDSRTPRGIATGTPLADSAGSPSINLAGDRTFYTKGWTTGQTGIMLKGDMFQLGSGLSTELYEVVEDANSDGSGLATLEIEPPLRSDIADSASITIQEPKGLFRFASNDIGWDSNEAIRFGFAIAFEEAL